MLYRRTKETPWTAKLHAFESPSSPSDMVQFVSGAASFAEDL